MKRSLFLAALALFTSAVTSFGAAIVTIRLDSGSQFLRDSLGVFLTGGGFGDGNGAVLQLGYYDGATTANNFLGNWVALSGEGSLNTGLVTGSSPAEPFNKTSIGDSASSGAGDGQFALALTFELGSSQTGNNLPNSVSIPLAIRFYNGTSISTSTHFNVVSNDLWTWKTPAEIPANPEVFMSLSEANSEWQGGASSEFKTTLPVPEPSTGLALLGGVALLVAHRRRR